MKERVLDFGMWLDNNFSTKSMKPLALSLNQSSVLCNNKMVAGDALFVTSIGIFLYIDDRRQVLIVWDDKLEKPMWINWPIENQPRTYQRTIIEKFHNVLDKCNASGK